MRRGEARHRDHGHVVESYHRLRRLAVLLLMLAGAVLIAWLLLGPGG
jgi:hypothetical protein